MSPTSLLKPIALGAIIMTPEQARALIDLPEYCRDGQRTVVAVAMSGGVDSSVVASLAAFAGYRVIGLTLQLYDSPSAPTSSKSCCAGIDIKDARAVAQKMRIRHYTLDYQQRFHDRVIAPFVDAYLHGQTPVPCVLCNQRIKFSDLLSQAKAVGADALLTGHYVQRRKTPDGGVAIYAGKDRQRDQSYFLFATTQAQAALLRFPLGGLSKTETRQIAEFFNLPVASKPASQDICFVPHQDYRRVVLAKRPEAKQSGAIVDQNETVIGQHDGIVNFTVGQRKKIQLASTCSDSAAYYVTAINPATNTIKVGRRHDLAVGSVVLDTVNYLAPVQGEIGVKYRSQMDVVPAWFSPESSVVTFASPQHAVAPGQACVFYHREQLLGGGWIQSTTIAQPNGNEVSAG